MVETGGVKRTKSVRRRRSQSKERFDPISFIPEKLFFSFWWFSFHNRCKPLCSMLMWEREDRGVEEVSTEIRNQGARNGALSRSDCAPGRSTGGGGRSTARSTGVHERAQESSGRPTGRLTESRAALGWARSTGTVDRPVDRQVRLDFTFRIWILFWMESNPIWVSLNPGTLWL